MLRLILAKTSDEMHDKGMRVKEFVMSYKSENKQVQKVIQTIKNTVY